ncbi:hypothetical protein PQQ84_14005 [Paraburkholderia strydomiana]|jgi:hypothetical protein|uniref:hypothetical protein n=1 Tax=Paraburkholderia strydomiana TaxID=1245417 RepID=UPI0038BE1CB4
MIKLEINVAGAGKDELRQFEALLQKIVVSLQPHMAGVETTVVAAPAADRYESTKKKILNHIGWRKIDTGTCMTPDFWEVDIQDWLNPKDKRDLGMALESLCEDGMLECTGRWKYYLTTKGYDEIY